MMDDLLAPDPPTESTLSTQSTSSTPPKGASDTIASALPILKLMEDIAQELRPLTMDQISDLIERAGRPTPKATLHRQLKTLEAAGWITPGLTGKWRPAVKFNGLAVAYQQSLIARAEDLMLDAAAVHNSAQEIINNATRLQ